MGIRKRLPETLTPEQWDQISKIAYTNPERLVNLIAGVQAGDEIPVDLRAVKPYSPDELAALYGIDLEIYECTYYHPNVWSVGAKYKEADGSIKILKEPLYQSKAVFRRKKPSEVAQLIEMFREARSAFPSPAPVFEDKSDQNLAVELCLYDFHIGKESIDEDWSLDRCREVWWQSINELLSGIPLHKVSRFVLPVGNDLLQVDNSKGTTYNGTPVGSGSKWFRNLVFGKDLVCDTIQFLSQYAPIIIPMIRGNHDDNSVMAMGEMVSERFRDRDDVQIINSSSPRVYWRWGTNLIGWLHGDMVKAEKAAQLMPIETGMDYAQTTYRAMHLGHIHTRKRYTLTPEVVECYGIDVIYCPSLSPLDQWHSNMGFVGNQRRSQAFIYDVDKGLVGERFFNLQK